MSLLTTLAISGGASAVHPNLYLPDGWDTGWKAAKAASGSTPCWATVIGDSLTYGQISTDQMSLGWANKVRNALAAQLGSAADFWYITYSAAYAATQAGTFAGTPPFVVGGASPSWNSGFGLGVMLRWTSGAPANALTFTTPYACTDLDIVYNDRSTSAGAPAFTYTVDGGAPVNGPVTTATTYNNRVQITGLANTTHVVVFSGNTANDAMVIQGITTYTSRTAGLGFGFAGRPGSDISHIGTGTVQLQAWAGQRSAADWAGLVGPTAPHLAIIGFGVNDCRNSQVGPRTFQAMNEKLIKYLRRARPAVSIFFVINSFPELVVSDSTAAWSNPESWQFYMDAMLRLAADYTCGAANINARWGQTSVTQGFRGASDPHYTNAGHADIAAFLEGVF